MNKSQYKEYLASRKWAVLREKVRFRSGNKCERCLLGNHDATHHLTYERIGKEDLEDLIALCDNCHEYLSGKSDKDPLEFSKAAAQEILDYVNSEEIKKLTKLASILRLDEDKSFFGTCVYFHATAQEILERT